MVIVGGVTEPAGAERSPKTGIRFAYRCINCGLNQSAHTTRGIYTRCRSCGTVNAGPAAMRPAGEPVPVAPRGRPRKKAVPAITGGGGTPVTSPPAATPPAPTRRKPAARATAGGSRRRAAPPTAPPVGQPTAAAPPSGGRFGGWFDNVLYGRGG